MTPPPEKRAKYRIGISEFSVSISIIGALSAISGLQLFKVDRANKATEQKTQIISEFFDQKLKQLEENPESSRQITSQVKSKFPDFRAPAILVNAQPDDSSEIVKIAVLEYRIENLEKAIKETASNQPPWWVLLVAIPIVSAILSKLLNPVMEYLGELLKIKTKNIIEK